MAEKDETTATTEAEKVEAQAAAKTEAESGGDRQEVRQAAAAAAPTLTEAQLDKIADRVIAGFEDRGAFEAPQPEKKDEDEAEAHGEPTPEPEAEKIPPKRSLAQRYAGQE